MNVVVSFRNVLRKFSPTLVDELDNIVTRINTVWRVDHDAKDGGHTGLTWTGATQTTVGAAGGATALPATPAGYLAISVNGTEMVVPYYVKS